MRVGVALERKTAERRVALTPSGARVLVADGHKVLVERGAGKDSGFDDAAYVQAGARLVGREEAWRTSELLVKVKEPIQSEYKLLHEGLTLFAYLHLAPNPELTEALMHSGGCAIAYETIEDAQSGLPLLAPMSEIAGRLATQAGAYFLQAPQGGNGVLIGGAPGVAPARVLVLGGGTAGTHAARVAAGMGAEVTILELSLSRVRALEQMFDGRARVLASDSDALQSEAEGADLLIAAALIHGEKAPQLITRELVERMKEGSVLVDIAIDQGGCAETSRATSHEAPTFVVSDVVHYCVANMPGGVPSTSTRALTNATLPYVRSLAALGVKKAIDADAGLALGVNVRDGEIVYAPVKKAHRDASIVTARASTHPHGGLKT